LEYGFEIPAKIPATNWKWLSAPGLARRSRGGAEPPAVGLPIINEFIRLLSEIIATTFSEGKRA